MTNFTTTTTIVIAIIILQINQFHSQSSACDQYTELGANLTTTIDNIILRASFDHPTHDVFVVEFKTLPILEQQLNQTLGRTSAACNVCIAADVPDAPDASSETATHECGRSKLRTTLDQTNADVQRIFADVSTAVRHSLPEALANVRAALEQFRVTLARLYAPIVCGCQAG